MVRRFFGVVLALAVVGVAACDRPDGAGSITAPQSVTPPPTVRASYISDGTVHWVTFLSASGPAQTQTAVIGRYGGRINIGWSSLSVPPYTLWEDTRFTFTLQRSPYLSALLHAEKVRGGMPVSTFPRALTLTLNYFGSSTPIPDPATLNVYNVEGNGVILERLQATVDPYHQNVTTLIWHFSEYSPGLDALE